MDLEIGKKAAAEKAVTLIKDGMIVGLGTGSTAAYFIHALIALYKQGLKIQTVSSSHSSSLLAERGGIPLLNLHDVTHVDITVDGADEIDSRKRLIKGGGGAHLKEKILASSSRQMIVIADESKLVDHLGHTKLPVEIIPYGSIFTRKKIEALGVQSKWRVHHNTDLHQELFVTESGNFILDIYFPSPLLDPEKLETKLSQIPGVVETGFFFDLADMAIIGKSDGTTFNI
jgi:ribose 5-phosphate isomerase A